MKKIFLVGAISLVVILILLFVFLFVVSPLYQVNRSFCMASVEKEMADFKGYLEDTVNFENSNKFFFEPDKCFNENEATIKIEEINNQMTCSNKCGTPVDKCRIILFNTPEIANGYREKCLNISIYTEFLTDSISCPIDSDLEGHNVIDPREKMPLGQYVMQNVAQVGDTHPKICVYYKSN